jgi:hypothetical protein
MIGEAMVGGGKCNKVCFTLPSLPVTVNSLYQIIYSERRVELKPECRRWKSESKRYVPRFRIADGSSVRMDFTFHFPFHYRNGKPRVFDVANLLKLTIDTIAEKCGFNDFNVRLGSWDSVDSTDEKVEVGLTEVVDGQFDGQFDYEKRIAALERINATLSAEIDVQRPVVEAAQAHRNCIANNGSWTVANGNLHDAVDAYETTRAAQAEVKHD